MQTRLVCTMVMVAWTVGSVASSKKPTPVLTQNLHTFGFLNRSKPETGSYSDVVFLTDETVLVTINERVFSGNVVYPFEDKPPSKLLLFDVSQSKLVRTVEFPIEKNIHSVRATQNGEFVLLNEEGAHLCSATLECGISVPGRGPVLVSPRGTKLIVGGNGQTEQKLLDSTTLRELGRFSFHHPDVVPGETALLVQSERRLSVRQAGQPERPIPFGGGFIWPDARFLNDHMIAGFESDTSLAVADFDGNILYRIPATTRRNLATLVASSSGARFCIHEVGYTHWNSIVNFLDIDSGRSFNFERVTVLETNSGHLLFKLEWDPRPYGGGLTDPALSPDGHRLAIIRNGSLEVFEIR